MKRLSASFIGLLSVSALVAACGGGSSEANNPQATASASSAPPPATASAASDMPPATATAVAEAPKPPAPEPGADLKVVAMKMSMPKGMSLELKADGTLWASKPGAKAAQIGNFTKNTLNITEGKAGTISVWKDNSVSTSDSDKKASFDDKDALVGPQGDKIAIDDKGKVAFTKADGSKDTKSGAPTFTGFKPEARRTALLLTVLYMMGDKTAEPAGSTSVPAATPAKAPPAKH